MRWTEEMESQDREQTNIVSNIKNKETIDREYAEELQKPVYDDTPTSQFLGMTSVVLVLALLFFLAAWFSYGMQSTGESGIGQTIFLLAMGIGMAVWGIRTVLTRIRNKKEQQQ